MNETHSLRQNQQSHKWTWSRSFVYNGSLIKRATRAERTRRTNESRSRGWGVSGSCPWLAAHAWHHLERVRSRERRTTSERRARHMQQLSGWANCAETVRPSRCTTLDECSCDHQTAASSASSSSSAAAAAVSSAAAMAAAAPAPAVETLSFQMPSHVDDKINFIDIYWSTGQLALLSTSTVVWPWTTFSAQCQSIVLFILCTRAARSFGCYMSWKQVVLYKMRVWNLAKILRDLDIVGCTECSKVRRSSARLQRCPSSPRLVSWSTWCRHSAGSPGHHQGNEHRRRRLYRVRSANCKAGRPQVHDSGGCLCLPSSWNRHVDFYWSTIRFIWSITANRHSARRPRRLQRARRHRATAGSTRHWRVSSTRLTPTRTSLVTKPTRGDPVSGNILDLILTSNDQPSGQLVSEVTGHAICFSDHRLVKCRLGVPPTPPATVTSAIGRCARSI